MPRQCRLYVIHLASLSISADVRPCWALCSMLRERVPPELGAPEDEGRRPILPKITPATSCRRGESLEWVRSRFGDLTSAIAESDPDTQLLD